MIKVLIVDDHASMREALATALTGSGEFIVVGEVSNADYALDFLQTVTAGYGSDGCMHRRWSLRTGSSGGYS